MLGLIIMIFFAGSFLSFIIYSQKFRTIAFWMSLMLFFDPGGFFTGYLGGNIIWRIKYYDVFFGLMLLSFIFKRDNFRLPWQSILFKKIIMYLFAINIYFLLVYGIFVPTYKGYSDFTFFLQKNRQYFYSLPLFIMTYRYSLNSVSVFYKVLIISSLLILMSYMLTLLTPIQIVPFYTLNRYGEANRIAMFSYGLIDWVLPMGIVYISMRIRRKLPLNNYLFIALTLMLITLLLTLTRREFIRIIFMVLVIPIIFSSISKSMFIRKYIKFVIPSLLVILILNFLFPKYIDLSVRLVNDTFHLVTIGEDTEGMVDYRVSGTGDLELAKELIKENPYFGIGYYPAQWSDVVEMKKAGNDMGYALDASSEVPVYGALMRLGIFGLLLPFFLYLFIYNIWMKIYRTLRRNFKLYSSCNIEILLLVTLLYLLLTKVTVDIYSLFGDFYSPYGITNFIVILAIGLGTYQRLRIDSSFFTAPNSKNLEIQK